jgi:outer membrane protein TolC
MKAQFPLSMLLVSFGILTGCSVGPNYLQPAPVALPMDWHWKKAEPNDEAFKGKWWELFHDPELNGWRTKRWRKTRI